MKTPASLPLQVGEPAFLTTLADELDRASGVDLIRPVLKATLLALVPALLIGWSVPPLFPGPEGPEFLNKPHLALPAFLLIAPALETVAMRYLFRWFGRVCPHLPTLNLGCALLWGFFHVQSPTWGLHAIWPFYVMGAIFLRLQARSLNRAYGVTILLHALFNLLALGFSFANP